MQLVPFKLKSLFARVSRVPARPVAGGGVKTCPPCSGNCMQGHACPAYAQQVRGIPSRTTP